MSDTATITASKPASAAKSNVAAVMRYFGQRPASFPGGGGITGFRNEWAALTPEDKARLTLGITSGRLTY